MRLQQSASQLYLVAIDGSTIGDHGVEVDLGQLVSWAVDDPDALYLDGLHEEARIAYSSDTYPPIGAIGDFGFDPVPELDALTGRVTAIWSIRREDQTLHVTDDPAQLRVGKIVEVRSERRASFDAPHLDSFLVELRGSRASAESGNRPPATSAETMPGGQIR